MTLCSDFVVPEISVSPRVQLGEPGHVCARQGLFEELQKSFRSSAGTGQVGERDKER